MRVHLAALVAVALLSAACGGDADATGSVDIPEGATFCSVFNGEYDRALDEAVPITDEGFSEAIAGIVAWAEVLASLAPDEIASEAQANLRYHQAQQEIVSAADFIPGSNAMHAWAWDNC